MDGIMTGEQVWIARGKHGTERGGAARRSIPRALAEADLEARREHEGPAKGPEELGAGPIPSDGSRVRRFAAWWIRGWAAFAAAAGEPYLSLAGRMEPGAVGDAPEEERRERPKAEETETAGRRAPEPASILGEAPAVG
jgi:hypothetical protein